MDEDVTTLACLVKTDPDVVAVLDLRFHPLLQSLATGYWLPGADRISPPTARLQPSLYRGAMRIAPSSRMVVPLIMALPTMDATSIAYSSGRPRRLGKGTC